MKNRRKQAEAISVILLGLAMTGFPPLGGAEIPSSPEVPANPQARVEEDEPDTGGVKSVTSELKERDTIKPSLLDVDFVHTLLAPAVDFKEELSGLIGLTFRADYAALAQRASYTQSGNDTGFSQVSRILGTWLHIGDPKRHKGKLVWKMETRNTLGNHVAPRDLGFDTGSALSTANFKELNYWGITDLYWKQRFHGGKFGFLVGHMDPGDSADQYPLLNAWTSFMNDAFYNNPTEAIPRRGFGMVGQAFSEKGFYLAAGLHDANGKDGKLDFTGFWDTREYFSWAEFGYRSHHDLMSRHNAHIHFWHQDARQEAGTEESWGGIFTHSLVTGNDNLAFVRAGYSEGDAAQMRRFIGVGAAIKAFDRDTLGLATSWGSPIDKSLRDQVTSEVFYRLQLTRNLSVSPDLQLIYQPSYAPEKQWVFIPGLRVRMVF